MTKAHFQQIMYVVLLSNELSLNNINFQLVMRDERKAKCKTLSRQAGRRSYDTQSVKNIERCRLQPLSVIFTSWFRIF